MEGLLEDLLWILEDRQCLFEHLQPLLEKPRRILEQPANILEVQHFIRTFQPLLDNLLFLLENFNEMRSCSTSTKKYPTDKHVRLSIRYFITVFQSTVCGRIVESFDKALQTAVLNYLPVLLLA